MSQPTVQIRSGDALQRRLRTRGEQLIGPHRPATDVHDEVGFRVTYLPNGEIIVTLADTCDLNTVHDLSYLIADACLSDDDDIDFTRDPTEADTRLRAFDQ
jgi:hypothetical protein